MRQLVRGAGRETSTPGSSCDHESRSDTCRPDGVGHWTWHDPSEPDNRHPHVSQWSGSQVRACMWCAHVALRRSRRELPPARATASRPKQRRDWCRRWLLLCEASMRQPCDWRRAGPTQRTKAGSCFGGATPATSRAHGHALSSRRLIVDLLYVVSRARANTRSAAPTSSRPDSNASRARPV